MRNMRHEPGAALLPLLSRWSLARSANHRLHASSTALDMLRTSAAQARFRASRVDSHSLSEVVIFRSDMAVEYYHMHCVRNKVC
jgi:hypothetical protein